MKHVFLLIALIFSIKNTCFAQAPIIIWEHTYGGSLDDEGNNLIIEPNGNILVLGTTESRDSDVTSPIGLHDCWQLRLDQNGNKLFDKNFGGISFDGGVSEIKTTNSGYIFAGESYSPTIPGYSGGFSNDSYIVKLDSLLNLEFQYCYGSLGEESALKIVETLDSGFVFVSAVSSTSFTSSGSVHGFHGRSDWWLCKIDRNGILLWSLAIGGTGWDDAESVVALSDGNFLVTGANGSFDGDVTCTDFNKTCRVVKVSSFGAILWDRCYGGTTGSEMGYDLVEDGNSGFVVAASTSSDDGDIIDHIGDDDIWVFKADSSGNIIWSHCYGGISYDRPKSISKTSDGGYLVCGRSTSNPLRISLPYDIIVVKIDSMGNQQWIKYLSGTDWDEGHYAIESSPGEYIVTGYTQSREGDISHYLGGKDFWVIKLAEPVGVLEQSNELNTLSGNIFQNTMSATFITNESSAYTVSLYDLTGRLIYNSLQKSVIGKNQIEAMLQISPGMYLIKVETKSRILSKLVIAH